VRIGEANSGDYIDPRLERAIERAVQLLQKHIDEWSGTVEAYWLVRRYEDEIGFPLTYNMVEEAVERARQLLQKTREGLLVET